MSSYSSKITENLPSLTPSQKTVANFVLENMDVMAFTTLDDVAMRIGVSTTTIIRFARMLGYSGYSDMQKDIQSELMDKVSLPERLTTSVESVNRDKLLADTMQNDIANITATISNLSDDLLRDTVQSILNAKQIYVLGLRSSFSLAHYTTSRLGQIRPHVRLVQSVGMIFPEEMVGSGSDDLCIAFLFPRYSKTTANLLIWLRNMGVRVILITSQNNASVQNYGDILIPCQVKGNSFKNSFTAPMCVINYLAAAVALEDNESARKTLHQTEEFLKKGYYLGL